jgi:hypothetical protein
MTAEYAMLPRATNTRTPRERAQLGGRTQEIQRLIGRSIRAMIDDFSFGEFTLRVDCDVLACGRRNAHGRDHRRRAWRSIDAFDGWSRPGASRRRRCAGRVAAVSVGLVDGTRASTSNTRGRAGRGRRERRDDAARAGSWRCRAPANMPPSIGRTSICWSRGGDGIRARGAMRCSSRFTWRTPRRGPAWCSRRAAWGNCANCTRLLRLHRRIRRSTSRPPGSPRPPRGRHRVPRRSRPTPSRRPVTFTRSAACRRWPMTSGLCVDALGGRPGVHSKRWSGSSAVRAAAR